jgi:hypothetical protein
MKSTFTTRRLCPIAASITLVLSLFVVTYHEPAHAASWLEKLEMMIRQDGQGKQRDSMASQTTSAISLETDKSESIFNDHLEKNPIRNIHKSENDDVKVVESEGYGETRIKAKGDAIRNAVQKTVGGYVSADLASKNDQIIKDEVLSYSAGYIDKMEVIEEEKSTDGSYRVKIKAEVISTKLVRQLKALNIATSAIDSDSIFAEHESKLDIRTSAADMWNKQLADFFEKALVPKIIGKPLVLPIDGDNVLAVFRVNVQWDPAFKQEFINLFQATKVGIAPKKTWRNQDIDKTLVCYMDAGSNYSNNRTGNEPKLSDLMAAKDFRLTPHTRKTDIHDREECGYFPFPASTVKFLKSNRKRWSEYIGDYLSPTKEYYDNNILKFQSTMRNSAHLKLNLKDRMSVTKYEAFAPLLSSGLYQGSVGYQGRDSVHQDYDFNPTIIFNDGKYTFVFKYTDVLVPVSVNVNNLPDIVKTEVHLVSPKN